MNNILSNVITTIVNKNKYYLDRYNIKFLKNNNDYYIHIFISKVLLLIELENKLDVIHLKNNLKNDLKKNNN